jgi:hypothetical protein
MPQCRPEIEAPQTPVVDPVLQFGEVHTAGCQISSMLPTCHNQFRKLDGADL